jgi:hypothetical protein
MLTAVQLVVGLMISMLVCDRWGRSREPTPRAKGAARPVARRFSPA